MANHSVEARRPQPVLTRSTLTTVIAVLSALLAHYGLASAGVWLDGHSDAIAGAVLAAGPTVSALLARRHVTPLAAPVDADGNELVPAGSAPATIDAARVLAETNAIHPVTPGA